MSSILLRTYFFFFNDTATTEIYTLSLHDALPISSRSRTSPKAAATHPNSPRNVRAVCGKASAKRESAARRRRVRSEEHTSELQSRQYLVCRLLLEKKKIYLSIHFSKCTIQQCTLK